MNNALFINGIFEHVLQEIETVQRDQPDQECFLQPHSTLVIRMLQRKAPSIESPIRLYASPHTALNLVSYVGDIVRWEDKRELTKSRKAHVRRKIRVNQPDELELFLGDQDRGSDSVNLITVRGLRRLNIPLSVGHLTKSTDGQPHKERSRAGGWSEVYDIGADVVREEQAAAEMSLDVAAMSKLSDDDLQTRLRIAPKRPQRRTVLTFDFVRSAAVVVAVLRRANGVCEACQKPAPFARRSDGTPYLEVHHLVRLADGGLDTVQNAAALCPNCHRQTHHG